MKRYFILLAMAGLLTSCATIFCGSKARVTFESDIQEKATLTIDGRKHTNVTFPYTTKIKRGFDETVVKGRSTLVSDGDDHHRQEFQCCVDHQPVRYTRLGHRCRDGRHDETRIQILPDRLPADRKTGDRKIGQSSSNSSIFCLLIKQNIEEY